MTLTKKMTVRELQEWHRGSDGKTITTPAIRKNLVLYGLTINSRTHCVDGIAYAGEYNKRQKARLPVLPEPATVETSEKKTRFAEILAQFRDGIIPGNQALLKHLQCVKVDDEIAEGKKLVLPIAGVIKTMCEYADIVEGAFKSWEAFEMTRGVKGEELAKLKAICSKVRARIREKIDKSCND